MADSDRGNSSLSRYVILRDGLALPVEPILLALALERRGFSLRREGEDTLVISPHQRLTVDDRRQVRRWKAHLLALLRYADPYAVQ
jgi:hypothetical protein